MNLEHQCAPRDVLSGWNLQFQLTPGSFDVFHLNHDMSAMSRWTEGSWLLFSLVVEDFQLKVTQVETPPPSVRTIPLIENSKAKLFSIEINYIFIVISNQGDITQFDTSSNWGGGLFTGGEQ